MEDRAASTFELSTAQHGVVEFDTKWPAWREDLALRKASACSSASDVVAALATASILLVGGESFEQPEEADKLATKNLNLSPEELRRFAKTFLEHADFFVPTVVRTDASDGESSLDMELDGILTSIADPVERLAEGWERKRKEMEASSKSLLDPLSPTMDEKNASSPIPSMPIDLSRRPADLGGEFSALRDLGAKIAASARAVGAAPPGGIQAPETARALFEPMKPVSTNLLGAATAAAPARTEAQGRQLQASEDAARGIERVERLAAEVADFSARAFVFLQEASETVGRQAQASNRVARRSFWVAILGVMVSVVSLGLGALALERGATHADASARALEKALQKFSNHMAIAASAMAERENTGPGDGGRKVFAETPPPGSKVHSGTKPARARRSRSQSGEQNAGAERK